jgi:hypothetical protein
MSNQLKLAAIAILIIVIGSGSIFISGVFKPKKVDQLVVNSTTSINSISNSNSSSSISSGISSVPSVTSSAVQSIQSSSQSQVAQFSSTSKVKESQNDLIKTSSSIITKNSNITPKFVTDLLNCPTKFTAYKGYYRLGIYKDVGDKEYNYLCIPQNVVDECNKVPGGMRYGFKFNSGSQLETMIAYLKKYGKNAKIEIGKYYCNQFSEGGSIFATGYPMDNCPNISNANNLIVYANNFEDQSIECLEVPINFYNTEEQKYIKEQVKSEK